MTNHGNNDVCGACNLPRHEHAEAASHRFVRPIYRGRNGTGFFADPTSIRTIGESFNFAKNAWQPVRADSLRARQLAALDCLRLLHN